MSNNSDVCAIATSERISLILDRLLDKTLVICLVISVVAMTTSLVRGYETGFQYAHVAQIAGALLFAVIMIFRKKLTNIFLLIIVIAITMIVAVTGLLSYGLFSQGIYFLICATITTSVFINKKKAIAIMICSVVLLGTFMLLFNKGVIVLPFDANRYNQTISSWLNVVFSFVLFTGFLVTVTMGLFDNMKKLAHELSNKVEEIQGLNNTLEQKVIERTSELLELNKEKDKILGIVAHDINNRLSGIGGLLDLIKEGVVDNEETKKEYMRIATDSCYFTTEIIKDMLEYSHNNATSDNIIFKEQVDLCSFVIATMECKYPQAIGKGVTLKLQPNSEKIYCSINRVKLSRAVDNLITNAIKFTPQGGEVQIELSKEKNRALIKIIDNGIGIPEKLKEHIFEPFTSSGRSGTDNEKSTGLGLSITKKIVEMHDGQLWFESTEGKGATFLISLPEA